MKLAACAILVLLTAAAPARAAEGDMFADRAYAPATGRDLFGAPRASDTGNADLFGAMRPVGVRIRGDLFGPPQPSARTNSDMFGATERVPISGYPDMFDATPRPGPYLRPDMLQAHAAQIPDSPLFYWPATARAP